MTVLRLPSLDSPSALLVVAREVSLDLGAVMRGEVRGGQRGLRAFLEIHTRWWLHGYCVDPSMSEMREVCAIIFGSETIGPGPFVRGLRSLADVGGRGDAPAMPTDRDCFWSCVEALSIWTMVPMPARLR